jgi:hypothetical protein
MKRMFNEQSSSDSDYETDESSLSEEEEIEDFKEELVEEEEDNDKKPPPTWLFLEFESLKKCMEKNCRCLTCNGLVESQDSLHPM